MLIIRSIICVLLALTSTDAAKKASKSKAQTVDPLDSIEHVDEDRIDEIIDDGDKHLVIFFCEFHFFLNRRENSDEPKSRCGTCARSLAVLEEIDDDLEANGLIDVVKTDDRDAMKQFGVHQLPSIVYVRRGEPILYDGSCQLQNSYGKSGEMDSADEMLRWMRAHDQIAHWDLDDDDFEDRTESAQPDNEALDWFIMFYDSKEEECVASKALWETVAHRLRGLVHCGSVDVAHADDVADRFKIDDDDDCPEFILMHKGKMYEYKDPAVDSQNLVAFALYKYKEQRGHRVPEAPTQLEEFVENVKENAVAYVFGNSTLFLILTGIVIFFGICFVLQVLYKSYKDKKE